MSSAAFRSDFALIRHLSKTYDPLIGRSWQDLPLIQMPPARAVPACQTHPREWSYKYRPYDDMVLDFGFILAGDYTDLITPEFIAMTRLSPDKAIILPREYGPQPGNKGGCLWARVTTGSRFMATVPRYSPWWLDPQGPRAALERAGAPELDERHLVLTIWVQHPDAQDNPPYVVDGMMATPETVILWFEAPHRVHVVMPEDEKALLSALSGKDKNWLEGAIFDAQQHARIVGGTLNYLGQCPEYLVEEQPAVPQVRRPPSRDRKPWTFQHLPRVILLDPEHAPSRSTALSQPGSGSHASPRPHSRRGHWRTLQHPRFGDHVGQRIYVKPAWIGPTRWMLNGAVYRVLEGPGTEE